MAHCDVTILGAGPYGLAATAHLKSIQGLEVRTFGQPMTFWSENMPVGMFLRSGWSATHIAHPTDRFSLEEFIAASGKSFTRPVPLDRFVAYGQWFQQQVAPDLDRRKIAEIDKDPKGFRVTLEDGEVHTSKRVVVAAGIGAFPIRPEQLDNLPVELASHASQHSDLRTFAGKQILVIGSGQSALESAALLHEGGALVEVIARRTHIHWLQGVLSTTLHYGMGKFVKKLLYNPADVGPAGMSQLMARPDLVRILPRSIQDKLWKRAVRPAGSGWLRSRLQNVPIRLGRSVRSAVEESGRVRVKLDDGSERLVDHVLMGTGYRVDISKYGFLSPGLANSIERVNGYPTLQPGMETSVPGLHMLGAPGARSFGPLLQFVSGAHYACASLLRSVAAKGPRHP
jgi:FAD-dependent urate hydroxylase